MRKNNFLYMLKFLGKYSITYFIGLLIISSYYLLTDTFTGKIYGIVITVQDVSTVYKESINIFITIAVIMTISALGMIIFNHAIAYANKNIRIDIVHAFQYMSLGEYDKRHSGDWITIFNKDVDCATDIYRRQARRIFSAIISSIGGLCILTTHSLKFTIFTIIIGFLCMGLGISRRKPMRRVSTLLRQTIQDIAIQISNLIQGTNEIKYYQMGDLVKKWYKDALVKLKLHNEELTQIQTWSGALGQLGTAFCYSSGLIYGLYLVSIGDMNLSQMIGCWPISLGTALGIQEFGFFSTDFQPISISIRRIRELLSTPKEAGGVIQDADFNTTPILLENVSFSYGDKKILSNINLEIKNGEKVAIVGKSGSGKTTLVKLLLRIYDADSGNIQIFGQDITDYNLQFLRSLFSYVPQGANILSGSILQNIKLGNLNVSEKQVIEAADASKANEFIEKFPEKFHTKIGINGVSLSGGEQQRIAIARALLKNGPICLLDEATSALDSINENSLIKNLEKSNQTLLIITHRPAVLNIVDKVITIENGHIISVKYR